MDFIAALAMCFGLIFFTLADSKVSPKFSTYGVLIISLALVFDAVIGNVQELAMKKHKAPNSEVVFYSYGIGFVYLLVLMVLSGNFISGFQHSWNVSIKDFSLYHFVQHLFQYPMETYGYGFFLSVSGYLGIQIVLTLVRTTGATTAVTVTTARKAMSIAVSFIFFKKPFTMQYVWSGLIIVLGIYLNVMSKRYSAKFTEFLDKIRRMIQGKNDRQSQEKLLDV